MGVMYESLFLGYICMHLCVHICTITTEIFGVIEYKHPLGGVHSLTLKQLLIFINVFPFFIVQDFDEDWRINEFQDLQCVFSNVFRWHDEVASECMQ